jgi:hypothetical protein
MRANATSGNIAEDHVAVTIENEDEHPRVLISGNIEAKTHLSDNIGTSEFNNKEIRKEIG